jgi:hypothetical protein
MGNHLSTRLSVRRLDNRRLTTRAVAKHSILLRFCVRGRGGDRCGHRGLLRGGGLALARFVCAATRYREKTGGDAGKDDFFHIQFLFLLFGLFIYSHIIGRRLVKGYQV